MALCLICAVHEDGHFGDEIQCDAHFILDGGILGDVRIGIQREDAPSQFVHNVVRGRLHDGVHQKSRRQLPACTERAGHDLQLLGIRQHAEQQQVDHFLKDVAVFPFGVLDQVIDIITPVNQLSRNGLAFSFVHYIAVHVTNPRNSGDHTGAVRIAQATLDIKSLVVFRFNCRILFQISA